MIGRSRPCAICQCEEAGVHLFPAGQPKRNVGNAQYRFNAQTLFHHAHGFQSFPHRFLLGAGRKSVGSRYIRLPAGCLRLRPRPRFFAPVQPLLRQRRDTVFIQRQAYDRSSVFFADGKQTVQHRLFPVYRVDDRLAVAIPEAPLPEHPRGWNRAAAADRTRSAQPFTARIIISCSSISGRPTFTSRISAPAPACSTAWERI